MKLIVTKFGGTAVGTIDRIKSVATRIKNEVDNGYNVIVVVSAMAGETNRLIKLVECASLFNNKFQLLSYNIYWRLKARFKKNFYASIFFNIFSVFTIFNTTLNNKISFS